MSLFTSERKNNTTRKVNHYFLQCNHYQNPVRRHHTDMHAAFRCTDPPLQACDEGKSLFPGWRCHHFTHKRVCSSCAIFDILTHCPVAELNPSVTVEGMKRLLCQVFSKHEPILNLSHQQYVIAAAWHFKPCGPSLTLHNQPLQYDSKYDPFFMYNTLGERLCLDSQCTVWVLFALAGIVAVAGSASYLYSGWLMSEPIMLGLCANSAVLSEFHLRVNVRAPRVWNRPLANLQTWFINGFLLGWNAVKARWLNCRLLFFIWHSCVYLCSCDVWAFSMLLRKT